MTHDEREHIRRARDQYQRNRLGLTGHRGRPKPKGREQCHALNDTGTRCRWYARPGTNLCGNHVNMVERGNTPTLIAA